MESSWSAFFCCHHHVLQLGHKVDEEQIAQVEHQARIMEWCTIMVIDSIQHLMAVIPGDCAQLAPHHIPGVGMGKVEAAEDLEP